MKLPGMLVGKALRSRLPHAKILNLDVSKAARVPGVRAILTGHDCPKRKYSCRGGPVADETPLARDKVRYIGEEIAALAAVDTDTAEEALSLIRVDYQELRPVFDPARALEADAPLIHGDDGNLVTLLEITRGEIETALADSYLVSEDIFATKPVAQCSMEGQACVAQFDPNGRLTLWPSCTSPFWVRQSAANYLGLKESDISVIQLFVGGSFGAKSGAAHGLHLICALLALKSNWLVKMANTREEEFITSRPAVSVTIKLKTGVKKDGTLLAKDAKVLADAGAYAGVTPAALDVIAIRMDNLYRCPNIRSLIQLAYTNNPPNGGYRGFGNPQMAFALESQMDIIADKLSIDPLELRLKNAVQAGDLTVHGWKIGTCGLNDCLKQAAHAADWEKKRQKKELGRGLGLACMIHVSGNRGAAGNFDGSSAIVEVNRDGTAILLSGEGDVGQGASTVLAQIVAEELGADLDHVRVSTADTDFSPYCLGAWADRVTTIGGMAVKLAAADARRQLLVVAAEELEANPADLMVKQGKIYVKGSPQRCLTIAAAASLALYRPGGKPIIGMAAYDPDTVVPDPRTLYGNASPDYVFGVQIAEIKVDKESGGTEVINFVAANDLGCAVNPMAAEGQIEGAAAQGIGFATSEEVIKENGQVVNASFGDYGILGVADMPRVQTILVEPGSPNGPYGAKGVGEPGMVPSLAAIANAIFDAVGVRIKDLPLTSEKTFRAIRGI
jgi:CO/xanthine dehydrogenase Mo-binding subunit